MALMVSADVFSLKRPLPGDHFIQDRADAKISERASDGLPAGYHLLADPLRQQKHRAPGKLQRAEAVS